MLVWNQRALIFYVFVQGLDLCSPLSNLLFYVYNSTEWAKIIELPLSPRQKNEKIDVVFNNGAGPLVNPIQSLYHTDQYQIFQLMFNRALKDPRRTMDPSKATSFIIPYDFANDVAFMRYCGKNICFDFRKCPLAPQITSLLENSIWFKRNGGRDHLLMIGMNYAMDHYILKPKCKAFLSGICRNCSKIAIDDYSYLYGNPDDGIKSRGDYWHAVPFPSDFHWTVHSKKPFPWENENRPLVSSYLGSTQSYYGAARRLRHTIVHFCSLHPTTCRYVICNTMLCCTALYVL